MNQQQQQVAESCLQQLEGGTLTGERLRQAFEQIASGSGRRQDLLYLQASESALHSKVIGMNMLVDGQYADEPAVAGQ